MPRTTLCAALALGLVGTGCAAKHPDGSPEPGPDASRTVEVPGTGSAPRQDPPTDFDGDGFEDAAVVFTGRPNGYQEYGPVVVFRGGKDGPRRAGAPLLPGDHRPIDLHDLPEGYENPLTGDLNDDGCTDLVVQHVWSKERRPTRAVVLWGGEEGPRDRPVRLSLPKRWQRHPFTPEAIGDLDGDGHLDLVDSGSHAEDGDDDPARVVYGPLSPEGRPDRTQRLDGRGGDTAVTADFDRDRRTDLVLASDYDEEYEGDQRPTPLQYFHGGPDGPVFDARLTRRLSEHLDKTAGTGVHVVDVDGDGHPDILPLGNGGPNGPPHHYLRGGPDGVRPRQVPLPKALEGHVTPPIAVGDVTGDGTPDLVSTVDNAGLVRLTDLRRGAAPRRLQQVGPRTPGVPGGVYPKHAFPRELVVFDANDDGHDDILTSAPLARAWARDGGLLGGFWYVPGGADGLVVKRTRHFDGTAFAR